MATVLFEKSNRPREFRMPAPYLAIANDAIAEPPKVQHLKAMLRAAGVKKRSSSPRSARSIEDVILEFRNKYPGGFSAKEWRSVRDERNKMESIVREHLSADRWRELLGS